jgi:hypothetical protein
MIMGICRIRAEAFNVAGSWSPSISGMLISERTKMHARCFQQLERLAAVARLIDVIDRHSSLPQDTLKNLPDCGRIVYDQNV